MELDDNARRWLAAYTDLGQRIDALREQQAQARANLEAALGDAEEGSVDGQQAVTWKWVESTRIDTRKVRELLPASLREAVQTTSRARVLRVAK